MLVKKKTPPSAELFFNINFVGNPAKGGDGKMIL
jgi:hypothetical protein